MFEQITYETLLDDVLTHAPDGIDIRQGSIFFDAVSGICLQIAKMYTDIDTVFQYVFLSTTSGEFLDMKASEYGMRRLEATPAKYKMVYRGKAPVSNTRFFHENTGKYFRTKTMENEEIVLVSEITGTACNDIPIGDLAVPFNTVEGLTSAAFGKIHEHGTDRESDESLRKRIQEKIAGPAENGNKQHYKTWCESIDGVGIARIIPLWNGPNTVKAVLINPWGLPCAKSVVENVQNYVDPATKGLTTIVGNKTYTVGDGLGNGEANLGAHFTATAADSVNISIKFTAVIASERTQEDVISEVTSAVKSYFRKTVMETATAKDIVIRLTTIGAIIAGCPSVIDYKNLTLNGQTENILPENDGVPVLSEVIVNAENI